MFRSVNSIDSVRSNFIFLDTYYRIKQHDRFTCHCKSNIDHDLYCHRDFERLHSKCTNNCYCESASGNYSDTASGNLRRTADSNTYCKRSDNLYLDTINSAERDNGFSCYSKSDFNHNIHSYRHRQ